MSEVDRFLGKDEVAGSNPAISSILRDAEKFRRPLFQQIFSRVKALLQRVYKKISNSHYCELDILAGETRFSQSSIL